MCRYSLTQIAVDWGVNAADRFYYDVLFIGTGQRTTSAFTVASCMGPGVYSAFCYSVGDCIETVCCCVPRCYSVSVFAEVSSLKR